MRNLIVAVSLIGLVCAGCVTPKEYKYVKKPKDVVGQDVVEEVEDSVPEVTPEDVPDVDCKPACKGKQCGDDGCGGSCGGCGANGVCEKGKCICPSPHEPCFGLCCDLDLVCNVDQGTCCNFSCFDKECGKVCGKSCGTCPNNKQCNLEGKCACAKPLCGVVCCQTDEVCIEGVCCKPNCQGKECGPDGCGGLCGECPESTDPCSKPTCMTGKCSAKPAEGPCDDGDLCTTDDHCTGGTCIGDEAGCNDDNPCTADSCDPESGLCVHQEGPMNGAKCDDGNPCTGTDVCGDGLCAGTLLPADQLAALECTCTKDQDCDPLQDGDVCNGVLSCAIPEGLTSGVCVIPPETVLSCDDSNPCTDDGCDKKLGCVHPDDDTNPCDDGEPCNGTDICQAGTCVPQPAPDCNDKNPCTADECAPGAGCQNLPDAGGSCDDGDPCNGTETCSDGLCAGTAPLDCDDGNPCTDDACAPGVGCEHVPNDANSCDDANACNGAESCQGGVCTAGKIPDCNDSNPGTEDECVQGVGCDSKADDTKSCDDADPCNGAESCQGGVCTTGKVPDCNDNNPCTDDECVQGVGCDSKSDDANSCDDADPCNGGETCQGGTCTPGQGIDCDDSNPCTDDSCKEGVGCENTNVQDGTPCGDPGQSCAAGQCS